MFQTEEFLLCQPRPFHPLASFFVTIFFFLQAMLVDVEIMQVKGEKFGQARWLIFFVTEGGKKFVNTPFPCSWAWRINAVWKTKSITS